MANTVKKAISTKNENPAFELKGNVAPLTVLRLFTDNLDIVDRQLGEQVSQLPHFFLHAPVVVDVGTLEQKELFSAFRPLTDILRRHRLVPVAVRNVNAEQQQAAFEAGLGLLQGELSRHMRKEGTQTTEEEKGSKAPAVATPTKDKPDLSPQSSPSSGSETESRRALTSPDEGVPPASSMLVTQPVRGGQIIYAHQQDLVVLAPVNAGAEVIADGHIHVYAPLRGRALAGALGNESARIFCSVLQAELVGIAGKYLLADEIPAEFNGKPTQVHMEKNNIILEKLL